jgi:VanZ family protein
MLPVVTIENLDKVVHAFFILYSHLFDIIFKTQIKHPDSYKPYVISFFCFLLLNYNRNYPGNTTTRKEDALDVVANTAGAALAVFCFFYIFKRGV